MSRSRIVQFDDGFSYQIRDGRIFGQVSRDSKRMDVVVDAETQRQVEEAVAAFSKPKLGRCECRVGDTPHSGAAVHKRPRSRCTRTATVQLRKAADKTIGGKPIPAGPWSNYCEPCAQAIEAYQGDIVERRKEAA